ncbi:MAG: PAC2 family protein [Actinobacteria bacterium]|nr:PAC2 family protein [Actinomycetota bacterium]MCI0544680.1 PAC2 family protein [Actinomycetota bacterium]
MAGLQWIERPLLVDPVGLLAFAGWGDAGESASQAAITFLEELDSELVAVIDPDDHFDFQVRRPIVELDSTGIRHISWPQNEIHAVRGAERDLVVVIGEEPHYRWKAFTSEVVDAMRYLGVSHAVTIGAFIGQVAHTLPVPLVGSSTRPDTLALHGLLTSGYEGPTGIVGVLNQALSNAAIDVISVWAAVPHYLSNQEYPPATEALAIKAAELLGISIETDDLARASRQFLSTVDEAIATNADLVRYVQRLEEETGTDQTEQTMRLVEEIEEFLRDQP